MGDPVSRRQALKTMGAVLLGGTAALASSAGRYRARGATPPNIIVFQSDDLGYGDLGCYGQTEILTTNLDALAAAGIRFTDYYAGSSICAPSRCALMTGLHTGHALIRRNDVGSLSPQDVTVADLLRASGYATAAIGKWHLGALGSGGEPWNHGFDYYFGNLVVHHDFYPTVVNRNTKSVTITGNLNDQRQVYYPDLCTQEALTFIRRHAGERFFLYLNCIIAHINDLAYAETGNPLVVPSQEPYADRPWPEPAKSFAAMVTRMDGYVGRIVRLLRALGIAGHTLFLFTSDNGPDFRFGREPAFFHSTGPLRGHKGELYEGGIRMPMIAYWPGVIPAGAVSAQVWASYDLLPTALELAGGTPPANPIDGVSIVPALLGGAPVPREYMYWESHEEFSVGPSQAVRAGDWKAIRLGLDQPVQLYDLAGDIGEQVDVAGQYPDLVSQAEKIMSSAHAGGFPPQVATKHVLLTDCVEPGAGLPHDTQFRWACRVSDYDGDAPTYVRLTIHQDGVPWLTADMTPRDSVTFRGRLYDYRRRLPPGNYHYQIEAADKDGTGRFPLGVPALGPVVPSHPYLTWTKEPGYEADVVEPQTGEPDSTSFKFRVLYCAHDGDLPEYVKLTLWRDGALQGTCRMKPSPRTADPVSGLIYFVARRLPAGEYAYLVRAADRHGRARGPASVRTAGLTVGLSASVIVTGLTAQATGSGGTQVLFSLAAPAEVTVEVTNLAGRPVATVARGEPLGTGRHSLWWSGRSAAGLPVPSGLYPVRVTARAANGTVSQSMTTCPVGRHPGAPGNQ